MRQLTGPEMPRMAPGRLRVAIVTSIHLDFDGRIWRHARSLVEAGCQVTLICPWAVPDGQVRDGVELRSFPRVGRRFLVPLLVPLRVGRQLLPILRQVDLIHFHDLDLLPWMALLSLVRPVVYDVHENYPDEMLGKDWIPRLLRKPLYHIVRIVEGALARMVRNCVLVVPSQAPRFSSPPLRVTHMRNYATRELLAAARDDYLSRNDVVVFTGKHYEDNGSLLLLEIAARSRARGLDLTFLMANQFSSSIFRQRLLAEIARRNLGDRIIMRPYTAAHRIMDLLNEATVGISPDLRVPTRERALPTKLFEYMAAGLPVVTSDLPNRMEIIAGSNAGLLARPEDPDTFVEALARLTADRGHARRLGLNGRRAFLERYCWESQVPSLLQFYDAIVRHDGIPAQDHDEERRRPGSDVVLLAANVDSGAPARLAQHLTERGLPCTIVSEYSAQAYRALMSGGPGGRLRARLGSLLIYPLRVVLRALRARPRSVIVTTNPFILPMVLVATRPLHRARVVGLLYDLIPDALQVTHGVDPRNPGYRIAAWGNRFWIRHADGVVFLGERMAEYTRETYGSPRRCAIIGVGADPREFEPAALGDPAPCSDLERWCEGHVVASYVGNLGLSHDWDTLAAAIPRAVERSELRCVVCASGPGAEALRRAWRNLPPDRVRFEPPLPDRAWARLLVRSAISLVTVREQAVRIPIGFPSKMFSAMAAGSAIVAVGPPGSDPVRTVSRYRCGVSVMPGDVEGLAQALVGLASGPEELATCRHHARRAAVEDFDLRELARRWHQLLDEVSASGKISSVSA
jgi:glycosyltransferase involved in cell wall biosynthesis